MRIAIIDGIVITNILEIDDKNQLPILSDTIAVEIPENININIGDYYIDNKFKINYTNYEEFKWLKQEYISLQKQYYELSQRIFQLEKNFFIKKEAANDL